jgi:hypothetical protein
MARIRSMNEPYARGGLPATGCYIARGKASTVVTVDVDMTTGPGRGEIVCDLRGR